MLRRVRAAVVGALEVQAVFEGEAVQVGAREVVLEDDRVEAAWTWIHWF